MLRRSPSEQYPDIAPPTVMVRASYPGASAETIQKSVIIPLEEAINGVENMMYITSTATNAGTVKLSRYSSNRELIPTWQRLMCRTESLRHKAYYRPR